MASIFATDRRLVPGRVIPGLALRLIDVQVMAEKFISQGRDGLQNGLVGVSMPAQSAGRPQGDDPADAVSHVADKPVQAQLHTEEIPAIGKTDTRAQEFVGVSIEQMHRSKLRFQHALDRRTVQADLAREVITQGLGNDVQRRAKGKQVALFDIQGRGILSGCDQQPECRHCHDAFAVQGVHRKRLAAEPVGDT